MFFVLSEFRGIGLGWKLFEEVLKDAKFKNNNWALNGVPQMTKKYADKFGFDKYPKWQIGSFEAAVTDIDSERLKTDSNIKAISAEKVDFEKFIEYDTVMTGGIRRDGFIQKWLDSKNAFSQFALNSTNDKIVGVCNIRVGFEKQLVIGPFYADTKTIAESLLKEVLKGIPNLRQYRKIFLFPASTNQDAKDIFQKLADGKIQEYDAMYGQFTNHIIQVDASKIYSITEYAMSYC
uniref:YitH acetyltransferase (GNAT) domain-containing protein n=1 Tax=Panagrolaimus superbus TaxID=310955 RepID=A0A914Y4W3_9BILA